jgi:hypothetical protein
MMTVLVTNIVLVMTDGNTCTLEMEIMISTVNMNVTKNTCGMPIKITVNVTMDSTTLPLLNHTLDITTVNLIVTTMLKKMVKDGVSVQKQIPILNHTILVQISFVMLIVTEIMKQLMMVTLVNVVNTLT